MSGGVRPAVSAQLEDGFDFHGDVAGERAHADGAARADAVVGAPDFGEEFGTAVDDFRVIVKIRRGVHHAEHFDDARDAIQAAELRTERGKDREADLSRGGLAGFEVEVASDDSGDHRLVRAQRAVAGDVGEVAGDHERLVQGDGFRRGREFESEFCEALFG